MKPKSKPKRKPQATNAPDDPKPKRKAKTTKAPLEPKPKAPAPADELLRDRIRDYFGFRRFRPGQAEAVDSALKGGDTLVVMPTGSGKSLCFQLTALAF